MSRRCVDWMTIGAAAMLWLGCGSSTTTDTGSIVVEDATGGTSNTGKTGGSSAGTLGGGGSSLGGSGGMVGATGGNTSDGTGGNASSGTGGNASDGTGGSSSGGTGGDAGVTGGDMSGGTGGSTAMDCTGKPGAKRGQSMEQIMVGSTQRTFVYYAPMNLDPNKAVPFVIVPHGFTMTGLSMQQITRYNDLADKEGFVVAYPDGEGVDPVAGGVGSPWNVGTGVCGAGAAVSATGDDQSFVNAMIDFAMADQCIDEPHIFMTGFSMGGYFSHETGCTNPKIHGVGPHSGGTHDLSACTNQIMPVMIFHGDADPLITYSCATDARDKWAQHNGCMAASSGVDTVQVAMGMCEYNKGCPDGGQVALCTFSGMGHCWAGGDNTGTATGASFGCPGYETATDLGWEFFKKYAW